MATQREYDASEFLKNLPSTVEGLTKLVHDSVAILQFANLSGNLELFNRVLSGLEHVRYRLYKLENREDDDSTYFIKMYEETYPQYTLSPATCDDVTVCNFSNDSEHNQDCVSTQPPIDSYSDVDGDGELGNTLKGKRIRRRRRRRHCVREPSARPAESSEDRNSIEVCSLPSSEDVTESSGLPEDVVEHVPVSIISDSDGASSAYEAAEYLDSCASPCEADIDSRFACESESASQVSQHREPPSSCVAPKRRRRKRSGRHPPSLDGTQLGPPLICDQFHLGRGPHKLSSICGNVNSALVLKTGDRHCYDDPILLRSGVKTSVMQLYAKVRTPSRILTAKQALSWLRCEFG